MLKKTINIVFGAFLFLLPFQIQMVLITTSLFLQGKFNPYTTFFLTFSDILLAVLLVLIGIDLFLDKKKEKQSKYFFLLVIFLLAFIIINWGTYFWALDKKAVIAEGSRLILGILIPFCLLISKYFKNNQGILIKIFIASMGIQTVIGITQFLTQSSIGLYSLGESHISSTEPGIAKIDILDKKIVRPYGTFPHPNIFAGFLILATFLSFQIIKKEKYRFLLIILFVLILILTLSRSAWLALSAGILTLLILYRKKISIPFLISGGILISILVISIIPIVVNRLSLNDLALQERLSGIETSFKMIQKNPLGVGAGNFTPNLQSYTQTKLAPWEYQPVHNILLLAYSESGIQGMLILLAFIISLLIISITKNRPGLIYFVPFLIIMSLDHYLLTIPQGQILFALFGFFTVYQIK